MTEEELQHIEVLAQEVPEHGKVLEVGSFSGRSAWAWAKSVPETVEVHCVDTWFGAPVNRIIWDNRPDVFATKIEHFYEFTNDCPNVTAIRGDSNKVLLSLPPDSYDLIFLDGAHDSSVFRNDLYFSFALLKKDGILCGHDFIVEIPDVITETVKFSAMHNLPISFARNSSIWLMRK